jgi:hypothetical protein
MKYQRNDPRLIPVYECSDGQFRRADEMKSTGAVAMDAAVTHSRFAGKSKAEVLALMTQMLLEGSPRRSVAFDAKPRATVSASDMKVLESLLANFGKPKRRAAVANDASGVNLSDIANRAYSSQVRSNRGTKLRDTR